MQEKTAAEPQTFHFTAIAHVQSPYASRIDAPHQPSVVAGTESGRAEEALICFVPGLPEEAWQDLAGFARVWLLFVFDRSQGWTPRVRPPRGGGKRSVLATRSPHRPNAIGLSAVELLGVEAGVLRVRVESRVVHPIDRIVRLEERCDRARVRAVSLHAQRQRLEATQR